MRLSLSSFCLGDCDYARIKRCQSHPFASVGMEQHTLNEVLKDLVALKGTLSHTDNKLDVLHRKNLALKGTLSDTDSKLDLLHKENLALKGALYHTDSKFDLLQKENLLLQ
ncbi:hypothetical protein GOP47_0011265 [Adiantum capillus-veneris]|uniref:Uncharacterized protein n=1 Tax=Adiantum capillus-veneris TaxID=13818 RepID=A0A9D4ZGJ9_ADICA|nr:hypothetical protein GOP47_0011265 [Adiantum capillus-veneris]